ncbi:MAG: glucose-6-phosphate isomerase [Gammaproteobacteria bacterium]|nr:glucose-6-phosphate isomerase [Gammaproteobacteria bacterium]
MTTTPRQSAWHQLQQHHEAISDVRIMDLFEASGDRFERFSLSCGPLFLDYSKHRVNDETVARLLDLARACQLPRRIDDLFSGVHLNNTEDRPALHTALRSRADSLVVDGADLMPEVREVGRRMEQIVDAVRSGQWLGATGEPITDVVNIGIGGSDLGPRLACTALRQVAAGGPRPHFLSSLDDEALATLLDGLDPARTLFVVVSKSFGTRETWLNAAAARSWTCAALGEKPETIAAHFLAVSANVARAEAFGIPADNRLPMWDWVGGRYSLWSAVGLVIALAHGMAAFQEMLAGAEGMDQHFRTEPFSQNMPVMMALLGFWYSEFFGSASQAVLPYDTRLAALPDYLQQLEMESNGKSVDRQGEPLAYPTATVTWGGPGNNGQHAFAQLLHQGTRLIPVDYIVSARADSVHTDQHHELVANCLAQAEALMRGRSVEDMGDDPLAKHRASPGNRPSSTLLLDALTPYSFGALLALYEHKTFVQGVLWDINSFDQWGVEAGKACAVNITDELLAGVGTPAQHDGSTNGLIERYLKLSR